MKGYKTFYFDLTCRPAYNVVFQYEVGKTYEMDLPPVLRYQGFHFWAEMYDVFRIHTAAFYTRICEIEATGEIVEHDGKYATNRIRILHELTPSEIKDGLYESAGKFADLARSLGTVDGYMNTIRQSIAAFRRLDNEYLPIECDPHRGVSASKCMAFLNARADEWEDALKRVNERKKEVRQ